MLVAQVREDRALLRSKVWQLRGATGCARFDAALMAAALEEEASHADAVAAAQAAVGAADGQPQVLDFVAL